LDSLAGLPSPPPTITRVGLVATYGRWKGHDVFLDALARVSSAAGPVRGYIIGGPLYDTSDSQYTRGELQAMIESRRLGDRVGLTGFLSSPAAMRALDVIVHASTQPEPFGLVIAEAMACGRAVVTSGHGGAAEFVESGRNALIARPGDRRALADSIERLVMDPGLRQDLGSHARETALARFSSDRMARELAQVFEVVHRPAIAYSA
jgi:glycosyltransferase involved in cell wall biosynthesis